MPVMRAYLDIKNFQDKLLNTSFVWVLSNFCRGDKAFCSTECRCQQILSDEHKEKCRTKTKEPCESPLSPYLAPLPYDAGVAAA